MVRSTKYQDLFAGIVVFLVALPLCLGIALASNAPLVSGIITGIVGGIVVGMLSGSHTSVSGPAAGLTAVVIAQLALLGSFEAFLVALIIAGLVQIAMGAMGMGFIAAFFPSSVIKGLLAAIGIILILKQLPHLVGWDADADGDMAFWQLDHENTFSELYQMTFHIHPGALVVGLISLAILIAWDRQPQLKKTRVPSPLIVVALGVVAGFLLSSGEWLIGAEHMVQVPITDGLADLADLFTRPDFSYLGSPQVYVAGLTLALVASLETLLNLEAVDKIDPLQRVSPPNRELMAQGVGNTLLGFIGGLPLTSVIIRSSVNINAGAQTRLSAITHGLLLLLCVAFLPQWLNAIPLSCLAAILIMTGIKLASPKIAKQMWHEGMNQFLPFMVTVTAIVFTDLLVGVSIGLATSLVFILHSNLRRPLKVTEEQYLGGKVIRVVLANQVSFLNRAALSEALNKVPRGGHILLDGSHTDYIDSDILDLIHDFKEETAPARNVKVSLNGFRKEFELDNVIQFAEHSTHEFQKEITPAQVLQVLVEGNNRVRTGARLPRDLSRQIDATSKGQFPLGVVLSCMDSRAPVELIFDLGIGDVFSVRMAGNVISEKVLGSLEFGCAIAGAKLILVMGHTRCGAVSSAVEFYRTSLSVKNETGCDHLGAIVKDLEQILSHHDKAKIPQRGTVEREAFEDHIARQNVLQSIHGIMHQSSTIKRLFDEGRVAIAGCIYDVRNGTVDFIEPSFTSQPSVSEVLA